MTYEHAVTYLEMAHSKEDTVNQWVVRIEDAIARSQKAQEAQEGQ